jgi:hypothetical protein
MTGIYTPGVVPDEYDPIFFIEEFERIAAQLQAFEVPWIILTPQGNEPSRRFEGMIANANGADWNPGGGAGLYQYLSSTWTKL